MFTCIVCANNKEISNGGSYNDDHEDVATPRTKQAVKSLTSQVILFCFFLYKSCFLISIRLPWLCRVHLSRKTNKHFS